MPNVPVIDISCLPFTHTAKAGPYQEPALKASLIKLGAWEKSFSADELVAAMDEAGVDKVLVPAQQAGAAWAVSYEAVAELCAGRPDRIFGMAGIDPRDIAGGVRRLEEGVRDLGFVGAHSYPHWFKLSPADRVYYPFYLKCMELGVPVQIQVGLAYQTTLRNVGHPGAIDEIAADFQDLKILAIHTGYPWEREMCAVAWKHPNVYVGADTLHPRDWAPDLVAFIRGKGTDKVAFGTNYPCVEFGDALAGVDELGFEQDVAERLLRTNAARLYGLA